MCCGLDRPSIQRRREREVPSFFTGKTQGRREMKIRKSGIMPLACGLLPSYSDSVRSAQKFCGLPSTSARCPEGGGHVRSPLYRHSHYSPKNISSQGSIFFSTRRPSPPPPGRPAMRAPQLERKAGRLSLFEGVPAVSVHHPSLPLGCNVSNTTPL